MARDEEAAGIESDATKMEPPAYGLWRESVVSEVLFFISIFIPSHLISTHLSGAYHSLSSRHFHSYPFLITFLSPTIHPSSPIDETHKLTHFVS